MGIFRKQFFQYVFNLHQGNHFSADLDKSFEATDMPEVAIFVYITHISGIIPSTADMQGGLLKIIEISFHYTVAFNKNPAVFSQS